MRHKGTLRILLTGCFMLIPLPLLAQNTTKETLELIPIFIGFGGTVAAICWFIINQNNVTRKEFIAYTDKKFVEAIKYVDGKDNEFRKDLTKLQYDHNRLFSRYKDRGTRNTIHFTNAFDKIKQLIRILRTVDSRVSANEYEITQIFNATKVARRAITKQPNDELYENHTEGKPFDPFSSLNTVPFENETTLEESSSDL